MANVEISPAFSLFFVHANVFPLRRNITHYMSIELALVDPCRERKDFCINCNSRFMKVRPLIRGVATTKHFERDLKDNDKRASVISAILDCSRMEFAKLHKFEKNIRGNLIFRAKRDQEHIVYGVDKRMRLVFLRAIRNFAEYARLLEDNMAILRLLANARDISLREEAIDETADAAVRQADQRKKARRRTRGPYRKATTRFDS